MTPSASVPWDLPTPHLTTIAVEPTDIDAYNHVNNAIYMSWCDRAAWQHSAALGLPIDQCLRLDRGMAVLRSVIAYLRPALLGDTIWLATWLLPGDSRLCVRRRFQAKRAGDDATLARAQVDYVCIELSSGRPTRWPAQFRERYVALDEVINASRALTPV